MTTATENKIDAQTIDSLREIMSQVTKGQETAEGAAQDARDTIRAIVKEASKFGLTAADVIRGIFRKDLEKELPKCTCPSCEARRAQWT